MATLGNTSIGSFSVDITADTAMVQKITVGAADIEVDTMHMYGRAHDSVGWVKAVIWNTDNSLVSDGIAPTFKVPDASSTWHIIGTYSSKPTLLANTSYYIGVINQDAGNVGIQYDTGAGENRRDWTNSYGTPNDLDRGNNTSDFNLYITYDATTIVPPSDGLTTLWGADTTLMTSIFGGLTVSGTLKYTMALGAPAGISGIAEPGYIVGQRAIQSDSDDTNNDITYWNITSDSTSYDFADLLVPRASNDGDSSGSHDRGMICRGRSSVNHNEIEYITISTPATSIDFGNAINSGRRTGGFSNKTLEKHIDCGGHIGSVTNAMQYTTMNSPSNAIDQGNLVSPENYWTCTSNGSNNRGMSPGGHDGGSVTNYLSYKTISSSSNCSDGGNLVTTKWLHGVMSNLTNERFVAGGGRNTPSGNVKTIDYRAINATGNCSDWGDMISESMTAAVSNGEGEKGYFLHGITTEVCTINTLGSCAVGITLLAFGGHDTCSFSDAG